MSHDTKMIILKPSLSLLVHLKFFFLKDILNCSYLIIAKYFILIISYVVSIKVYYEDSFWVISSYLKPP